MMQEESEAGNVLSWMDLITKKLHKFKQAKLFCKQYAKMAKHGKVWFKIKRYKVSKIFPLKK